MTYKNVLAELKSRPEEKKMLLGGAWIKKVHPYHNGIVYSADATKASEVPECGCALAELVPGIVEQAYKLSSNLNRNNEHFKSLFDEQEKYNGMTFEEASKLESKNDNCMFSGHNSVNDCKKRAMLVEAYLEAEVRKEAETLHLESQLKEMELEVKANIVQ
jgi:hypothetical protein